MIGSDEDATRFEWEPTIEAGVEHFHTRRGHDTRVEAVQLGIHKTGVEGESIDGESTNWSDDWSEDDAQ
jgi:hypothetical protein